mmetsp:Transcript_34995/g.87573  ORF Transcript_34995/g.87573 Transcript_34995/m.87573 type:complete len:114 (-) Transcript_34995:157-498(-)
MTPPERDGRDGRDVILPPRHAVVSLLVPLLARVTTLLPPPTRPTAETPRAGAVAVACIIVRVVVGSRRLYALPTSRCSFYLGKEPKLDEVSLGFGAAVVGLPQCCNILNTLCS